MVANADNSEGLGCRWPILLLVALAADVEIEVLVLVDDRREEQWHFSFDKEVLHLPVDTKM